MARKKTNNNKDRMILSFTELDEDVYDFLKNQRNASKLIKLLVRQYMWNCKNNNSDKSLGVDGVPFISLPNTGENIVQNRDMESKPEKIRTSNLAKETIENKVEVKKEVLVEDEISATLEEVQDTKANESNLDENRLENKKLMDNLTFDD